MPSSPRQLPPGISVAEPGLLSEVDVELLWAQYSLRRHIKRLLQGRSRSLRRMLRHDYEALARESLHWLAGVLEDNPPGSVTWRID